MLRALDAPRRLPAEIDLALLWSTLALLVIGMVMVYSASMATAEAGRLTGNQPAYFLVRHAVFLAIGLVAAAVAFQVPLSTCCLLYTSIMLVLVGLSTLKLR